MMNVPRGVMTGWSPKKTVVSFCTPVLWLVNLKTTLSFASYVTSFSLHSSTVYTGSSKKWLTYSSVMSLALDSMGPMSLNAWAMPSVRNHSKLSVWMPIRFGRSITSGIFAKLCLSR